MTSRYAALDRAGLGSLVPELLLCGHLVDRAAMAWCIQAWGREEMARIAIEEWVGASPVYTRRMQRALGFEGDDVVTIFKGLQLDIGAPPQFMDFRFELTDRWHGAFELAHCGALMDVEPMGPDYVFSMCHTIEDPTFDATAVATNPRAQIRPVHRPPREPADRTPHCRWTVTIADDHPPVQPAPACLAMRRTRLAGVVLDPIDPADPGVADYSGPLVSDLDFTAFSRSALARLADEVAVQTQLLNLSFLHAVDRRAEGGRTDEIARRQAIGVAGLTAHRLRRLLGLPATPAGAARLLALHPMLNPAAYVDLEPLPDGIRVRRSDAHADGAWVSRIGPADPRPLQAVVRELDPHLDVEVTGNPDDWTARVVRRAEPLPEPEEVAVAKLSTGTDFTPTPRRSLPITPV